MSGALTPDQAFTSATFVLADGKWHNPVFGKTGTGVVHGPGFVRLAQDFPEGTRLVVSTQVLPPGRPALAQALRQQANELEHEVDGVSSSRFPGGMLRNDAEAWAARLRDRADALDGCSS